MLPLTLFLKFGVLLLGLGDLAFLSAGVIAFLAFEGSWAGLATASGWLFVAGTEGSLCSRRIASGAISGRRGTVGETPPGDV